MYYISKHNNPNKHLNTMQEGNNENLNIVLSTTSLLWTLNPGRPALRIELW
jgi:hypothetical protein